MWLPGYTVIQLGPSGGPYDRADHPKLCWHTTEGNTLTGAEAAFAPYPPHLGVDPRSGERHQYIDLDRCAYSLGNSDAEDSFVIQVEVVGYAAQTHTWPADWLDWLGREVARPVADAVGVPPVHLVFYGEDDGIVLASPSSPIRLTLGQWDDFAGHVGHQHCPGDDHWDPGRLDVAAIITAGYDQPEPEPPDVEDTMALTICAADRGDGTQYVTDLCTFKTPIADPEVWASIVWCTVAAGGRLYYQDVNNPVIVPAAALDGLPTVEA